MFPDKIFFVDDATVFFLENINPGLFEYVACHKIEFASMKCEYIAQW